MYGRSKSPLYDRRRSSPRRDRRELPLRRRRSLSRERFDGNRPRRASPGYKRFRREDDYHHDRYDRGSPDRRGGHDRERDGRDSYDRYHDRRDAPESYRDFIMNLPSDVTPEEAHRRYQAYLAEFHGSSIKAEFEQLKDEEWMKMKHDPRIILQIIEKHKAHAQKAVQEFIEAMKPGNALDIHSESFDQGVIKEALPDTKEDSSAEKGFVAPAVCWTKERIETDLKLSTELVRKLDVEKNIERNPILDTLPAATEPSEKPEGNKEQESDKKQIDDDDDVDDKDDGINAENHTSSIKKLDLLLTYLWRVHMLDYYSGHELNDKEFEETKCRMLRPLKEQTSDEQTDKRMLGELNVRVDKFWSERIKNGDPLQTKTGTARVEKSIEDFIEGQVVQIDDDKWGNRLSNKMFVGKEFVLKHIRGKHSVVIDGEREKILDEVYFDNFKAEKERDRKMAEEQERVARFGHQKGMDASYNGYTDGFGHGAPGLVTGQGIVGAPMVPAPMMAAPMGQMLLPAPGAGPLGPFVLQPVPSGGSTGPMEMGPNSGSTGGRNGDGYGALASSRSGNFGPSRTWSAPREYYDLDAPQNNRAFLDYGDL